VDASPFIRILHLKGLAEKIFKRNEIAVKNKISENNLSRLPLFSLIQ